MTYQTISTGSDDTLLLGELLGSKLTGGEVIELVADLGGGKTTFVQGLAKGASSKDNVASPTFTINKIYDCPGDLKIYHFDFYRLNEPGIIADQLSETISDPKIIVVVEWSDIVKDVLPADRLTIEFKPTINDPDERIITISYPQKFAGIVQEVESQRQETRS